MDFDWLYKYSKEIFDLDPSYHIGKKYKLLEPSSALKAIPTHYVKVQ